MPTTEERLADEVDVSLDQLSHWSGVPFARVRKWADLEVTITDEEQIRLKMVIGLYMALHDRLELAVEALDEAFPKASSNGRAS